MHRPLGAPPDHRLCAVPIDIRDEVECQPLAIRQYPRHLTHEVPDIAGDLDLALVVQCSGNALPTGDAGFARLNELCPSWIPKGAGSFNFRKDPSQMCGHG